MRPNMKPRPPDSPPDPDGQVLNQRASDVLTAMLFGTYGDRTREYAQAEIGLAWTQRRLADAPDVLLRVLDQLREHMLPVHLGYVAEKVAVHLLTGTDERIPATPVRDD
jgi:hypothetical protein